MTRWIPVAFSIAIVLTALLSGRAEPNAEEQRAKSAKPPTENYQFSVTAGSQHFPYDQPIALSLTLKNTGSRAVKVMHSNLMASYRFDVRLPSGKLAPLTLEGKRQLDNSDAGEVMYIALEAGKSDTIDVPMLNRLYDMTLLGEYTVKAYWQPVGKDQSFEVASNSLKIVIREREPEKDGGG